MKILELFSGTESFSRVARFKGHQTFTIDNNHIFKPSLCKDILEVSIHDIPYEFDTPDILWASPPCTSFSQMAVSAHWNYFEPRSSFAKLSIEMIRKTLKLIDEIQPRFWFIENPRSILRKFPEMQLPRKELCYCRYGEFRMKPTDIWTNLDTWKPRAMCYNGCSDHISAPRGSTTGTQGMNPIESGRIPQLLCLEILESVEKTITKPTPLYTSQDYRVLDRKDGV